MCEVIVYVRHHQSRFAARYHQLGEAIQLRVAFGTANLVYVSRNRLT
jgi:hypothetical protein